MHRVNYLNSSMNQLPFVLLVYQLFRHLLLVFGGLQGLEASLESDENLTVDDVSLLFQFYWNTCPNQGSRTIRTEVSILLYIYLVLVYQAMFQEAILITLSTLKPLIEKSGFYHKKLYIDTYLM